MATNTKAQTEKYKHKPLEQQKKLHLSSSSANKNQVHVSTAEASLPSKPPVVSALRPANAPFKQPAWSQIVAVKSDDNSSSTTPKGSAGNTPASLPEPLRNSTKRNKLQSPPQASPVDIPSRKQFASVNEFNSPEIFDFMKKRTEDLSKTASVFKDSGSAWVVKPNKKKDTKGAVNDVVLHVLMGHLKKVSRKEQYGNGKAREKEIKQNKDANKI